MSTFIERMEEEKKALDEKMQKLNSFVLTESFLALDWQDKSLLGYQLHMMQGYSDALAERLNRSKRV